MDGSEERALAVRLARMDESAWEELAHTHWQPLLAFLRFCLGLSLENAEETVQMTFLRCVKSIGTFDPARGRLLDWLKAVARNEAHTFLRGHQRHASHQVSLSALPAEVADLILARMDTADEPDGHVPYLSAIRDR